MFKTRQKFGDSFLNIVHLLVFENTVRKTVKSDNTAAFLDNPKCLSKFLTSSLSLNIFTIKDKELVKNFDKHFVKKVRQKIPQKISV